MTVPMKAQTAMSQFELAREARRAFEKEHARVLEEYGQITGAYDTAIDEVKNVYREHYENIGPKFGDFSIRMRTEVDPDVLVREMGDKAIDLEIVESKYVVNRKKYEQALKEGLIPVPVLAKAEKTLPPAIVAPTGK
jgi:hypothetical protein